MKRSIISNVLAPVLSVGALAAVCLFATPAAAQYEQIPATEIAVQTPIYHDGHAVYYWHNHWHTRLGTGWGYYTHPGFLHEHVHYVPVYHHYR